MPIVKGDRTPQDIGLPADFRVTQTYDDIPSQPDPTTAETWGAAYRTENLIGSYLVNETAGFSPNTDDGAYNAALDPDIIGGEFDSQWERFSNVRNQKYADALKTKLRREDKDRRDLQAAGVMGFIAAMGAGITDLPTLIPGGAVVANAKGGFSLGKSVLSVGGAAFAGSLASEIGLHATQELRTVEESAINISAATILGGLIGAGAWKAMSIAERSALNARFADDVKRIADQNLGPDIDAMARAAQAAQKGSDVGAAINKGLTKEQLGIDGKAAQILSNVGFNPMIRLARSASKAAREVAANLPEMSVYLKMTGEGVSQPQAVETYVKRWTLGAVGDALQNQDSIFKEMKKSGVRMSKYEFSERVGKAMRRGDLDVDGNEFISRAATKWRETVFDPLKKEAIDAGLLPEDVSVDTAVSYFSRMYNRNKIEANEQSFKGIVRKWAKGTAKSQYEKLTSGFEGRKAKIDQTIDDLSVTGPQRAERLNTLVSKLEAEKNLGEKFKPIDDQLSDLRSRIYDARQSGDKAAANSLSAQVKQVTEQAGEDYARFVANRNELRTRIRNIRNNITGLADEVERSRDKIADIESSNIRRLERLHRSINILEEKIIKEGPETHGAELSRLKTEFYQTLERSNAARERLAASSAKRAEKAASTQAPDDLVRLDAADEAAQARFEAAEVKRLDELSRRAKQIEDLENIDPEFTIRELRDLIDTRISQAANVIKNENIRLFKLAQKAEQRNPEIVKSRIKMLKERLAEYERRYYDAVDGRLGVDDGFEEYSNEVADSIFNQITGRNMTDVPDNLVPAVRGPLKERTFNIADDLIEDYLESDVELVGRRYARIMGADVEMTRKFGKADMSEQITQLQREYVDLRASVEADTKLSDKARKKQLDALNASERADRRDISALAERLRYGSYKHIDRISGPGRFVNAVNTFNYLRAMGGVTLSSLPDTGRAIMVHGVGRWLKDGVGPLLTDLKGIKLSAKEAKLAGAAAELVNNSRMATFAELNDPYAYGHPLERWLHNASTGFSKLNGMVYWNDFQKSFASVITQSRILENAETAYKNGFASLPAKEQRYMAFLGLGQGDAEKVGKMFADHGETRSSGVRLAHTQDWVSAAPVRLEDVKGASTKLRIDPAAEGEYAKRLYMAAVNKDVDSIIVTKGIGDTPLLADTNTGRMVLQFKSFMFASHQKMLMRGVQEDAAGVLSGMMVSTGIGMMVFALKQKESNREIPDNPGRWIAEGIDRSGMLGPLMELNNIGEKVTGVGLYSALQAPFEGSKKGPASRYAVRSTVGSVLGPSFGMATDIVGLLGSASRGEMTEADINAIGRLMPARSLPILRSFLEYYAFPQAREAVQ